MADSDDDSEEEKEYTVRLAEQGVTDPETMKAAAEAQAQLHRDRDTLEMLLENVDITDILETAQMFAGAFQQRSREVESGAVNQRQSRREEESRSPAVSPNRPENVEEPADEE